MDLSENYDFYLKIVPSTVITNVSKEILRHGHEIIYQ